MTFLDHIKRIFGSGRQNGSEGVSCEEALQLVHEFIDGELDGVSRVEVQAHFEKCQACYPHLRLEQRFREALRRACAQEKAPPELRSRVEAMVSGGRSEA